MNEWMGHTLFFGMFISVTGYEIGLLCRRKWKLALCNPLLIAVIFVMTVLWAGGVEYETYSESAGYLGFFLTPATVCLAIPLYERLKLLRQHSRAIVAGILCGVLSSLGSVLLFSRLFGLSHETYVTLLPKSITTAIGMGVSEELGGIPSVTAAVIIVTGVLGNIMGDAVCRVFRIEEPVAKGLALGTSAHAVGTARAMEMGQVEGAMSSLAIAVAGLITVAGASLFANLY